MALTWLAPSWYVFERRKTALTFVAASFWFGVLPDVDLDLSNYVQTIKHHGVFHTVVGVTLFAVILGPLLGWVLKRFGGGSEWFSPRATNNAIAIGVIGIWVASLSHLFGDMLSAPDVAPPIEPLWPVVNGPILHIDVVWYSSPWVNLGGCSLRASQSTLYCGTGRRSRF